VQHNSSHACVLQLLKLSSNVNECKPLPAGSAATDGFTIEAGAYTRSR